MQLVTVLWKRAEVPSSVKYFPTGQLVQLAAPGSLYLPAAQIKQVATLEAVEYFPGMHGVQVVAPVPVPVSVIDPALQLVQAVTLEAVEYFPGVHGVQVVAPAPVPVSMIDPALQLVQAATLEAVEYLPLTQPRHVRSAMFVPFIVTN